MPVHPDQSVSVLVDTQNMYHAAQNLYSNNLDYSSVLEEATKERRLRRALAYVVRTDTEEEETFFEALTRIGFETKVKEMKEYPEERARRTGTWVSPLTPSLSRPTSTQWFCVQETATSQGVCITMYARRASVSR